MIPGIETFHTRESWQDQRYPVFGPLDNPADNDTIVIHYTAADNLIDGDPGEHASDLPAYMRAMQRSYVLNRGYSLGYLFAVDWLGGVWQIRGWEFQSAANKDHNGHTWPILMLVDGADSATPEAVRSVQLIGYEASRRAGRPQAVKGHGQLRVETGVGTATACPGVGLQAQVNAGVFSPKAPPPVPPVVPEIPTTPLPDGDETVTVGYVKHPGHAAVYRQFSNGTKTWVTDGNELAVYNFLNGGPVKINTMPNNSWMKATGVIVGPVPAGVDVYGNPK